MLPDIHGTSKVAVAGPLCIGFGVCCVAACHQSKRLASPEGGLQDAARTGLPARFAERTGSYEEMLDCLSSFVT
jgi:hypothetical protein